MGNKSSNFIEINGKRYDAVSGALLGESTAPVKPTRNVGVIDGFTRAPRQAVHRQATAAITRPHQVVAPKKAHAPAPHISAHKPTAARTLMRSAVKKPDLKPADKIAVHAPADRALSPLKHTVQPKLSHVAIDPARQKRAQRIIQSPAVSRFGKPGPLDTIAPYSPDLHLQPLPDKKNVLPVIPVTPIKTPMPQPDIFASAIANSTSHQQIYEKPAKGRRTRLTLTASAGLVLLLAIGFFAYTNVPSISLRLASAKAGFQAKLPDYSPAGFSLGNLSYGPGNVTIDFKNDKQVNQQFAITQRLSTWDSNALLNNFVASANKAYQTYQRAGRTIYMYGNNTATWVSGGVWYTVDGNGLTRSQVLDMASTM